MPQHISVLKIPKRIFKKKISVARKGEQICVQVLLVLKAVTLESEKKLSEEGLSTSFLEGAN